MFFFNLFARELAEILAMRGLSLRDLRKDPYFFHSMVIDRLEKSITDVRHRYRFPTLYPNNLKFLLEMLPCTSQEVVRLHAALLTCTIGAKLLDRGVLDENVEIAMKEIFVVLVRALPQSTNTTASLVSYLQGFSNKAGDTEVDGVFDEVANLYDNGMLELNQIIPENTDEMNIATAYRSSRLLNQAFVGLTYVREDLQRLDEWKQWCECISSAREYVSKFLNSYGLSANQ